MKINVNKTALSLVQDDITEQVTDAIVNPANEALVLGAGVAGAIRSKGGPAIQKECDAIAESRRVGIGGTVITTGGKLKAKHVIHAVGPRMGEGDEDRKLRDATLNSLKLADQHKQKSISFPAISTGIFGYPIDRCANIMLQTTIDYLRGATQLQEVVFCLWGSDSFREFEKTLKQLSPK